MKARMFVVRNNLKEKIPMIEGRRPLQEYQDVRQHRIIHQ